MKNPVPYIRKTLFTVLNGNVTYNSAAVPVYEGEGKQGIPYQVLIREYSDADNSNKHFFSGKAAQVIEVVAEQNDATSKAADEIAEQVMNLIKPTTRSDTLSGVDFQVMTIGKPSISNLKEDSDSGTKIIRRILRFNLIIIER